MSELNLASELKDIHLPDPIGIFPLAPGWWIVLIIFILFLTVALFAVYRHYQNDLQKRKAISLLNTYQKDYQTNTNLTKTCTLISELLKRVALIYFPRDHVAALTGKAWIDFLNQTSKGIDFTPFQFYLTELPYKPPSWIASSQASRNDEVLQLFAITHKWISQRRGSHV